MSPTKVKKGTEYICPMDPEVHKLGPGACPMHLQISRQEPGSCPICGMALEPRETTAEESNPELIEMTRRFWISVPLLALMVSRILPSMPLQHLLSSRT